MGLNLESVARLVVDTMRQKTTCYGAGVGASEARDAAELNQACAEGTAREARLSATGVDAKNKKKWTWISLWGMGI